MKKIVYGLLAMCFSTTVLSQSAGENLQSKLNAISTMTSSFNQVVKANKKELSQSSGTMALQRPGRFRWKTEEPMEQLIVADGQKMWIYDIDLEQVSVKKQDKGLGGSAALFLSGYNDQVSKDFEVKEQVQGDRSIFDLKAKASKENIQRIKLIFTKSDLTALELYDQLGQTTFVRLSKIEKNNKISAKLFEFEPPKGVDVVQQ